MAHTFKHQMNRVHTIDVDRKSMESMLVLERGRERERQRERERENLVKILQKNVPNLD